MSVAESLQQARLAVNEEAKAVAYRDMLQVAGVTDICALLLKALNGGGDALGLEDAVDVLNTIHGDDRICVELVASPSFRHVLASSGDLKSDTAVKQLMEIIIGHQKNMNDDLRLEVVRFAGSHIASHVGVSDVACTLATEIIRACRDKEQTNMLLQEFHQVSASFMDNLDVSNSVIRTRYCSMMARLVGTKNRDDLFEASLASGAVNEILDLCEDTSDPLLQMNALELLAEFGGTVAGFRYVQERGTLLKLLRMAQPESEESDPLLGPEALSALSALFHRALYSSVLTSIGHKEDDVVPVFLETMITNIESDAENARVSGLNAIVEFASSSFEACKYITENGKAIETMVGLLRSPRQEMKVAALYGLAEMVSCSKFRGGGATAEAGGGAASETVFMATASSSDVEAISASLFEKIGRVVGNQDTLGFLLDILRQPFSEIRFAAMKLIHAAASFGYGIQLLFHSTKAKMFREFLDRHSDTEKKGKELKYGIVVAVANNDKFGLLSEENQKLIRTAVSRGPFYVPSGVADPQVI